MDRRPALPTLTERSSAATREVIEAWSISDLKRLGALEPGFVEEFEGRDSLGPSVFRLEAHSDAIVVSIGGNIQRLGINKTVCGKGGWRSWWTCPCGTRRGVLFLRSRRWGCRGCRGLPYRSQRMSRLERAMAKAKRLHGLLGRSGNLAQELPPRRPHGMRRRTAREPTQVTESVHSAGFHGDLTSVNPTSRVLSALDYRLGAAASRARHG